MLAIYTIVFWLCHAAHVFGSVETNSPTVIQSCHLETKNWEAIQCLPKSVLYVFEVEINGERYSPRQQDYTKIYKPWRFYMTSSTHGLTLLALSFNYDVLSLSLLTIGVETAHLQFEDFPNGCFERLPLLTQLHIIRSKSFDKFMNNDYYEGGTSNNSSGNNLGDYSDPNTYYYDDTFNAKKLHTKDEHVDSRNLDNINNVNADINEQQTTAKSNTTFLVHINRTATNHSGTFRHIIDYPDYFLSRGCMQDNTEDVYSCNEIIRNRSGYAEFTNMCCNKESEDTDQVHCFEQENNLWITVLYACIGLAKMIVFLFSPVFTPAAVYQKLSRKYYVKFTKPFKIKVYLGTEDTSPVRCKMTTSRNNISRWPQFLEHMESLSKNKAYNLEVQDAIIEVQGKRIIKASRPPAGLIRTLYENFVRCKISRFDPFKACCNTSIYPRTKNGYSWKTMFRTIIRIVGYMIFPLPFCVRLYAYYYFEEDELHFRQTAIDDQGLKTKFQPFRSNLIQFLSPTHGLLITVYVFLALALLVFLFCGTTVKNHLTVIVKSALLDMNNVSRTNVILVMFKYILRPFKEYGCIALLLCPFLIVFAVPVCALILIVYSVPTIYLSFRLLYHCNKTLGPEGTWVKKSVSQPKRKIKKLRTSLAKLDQKAHVKRKSFLIKHEVSVTETQLACSTFQKYLFQIASSIFLLVVLYSLLLLVLETIGMLLEVLVFTSMGLVVNAESTLKYFSIGVLVIVYMRRSYHTVYKLYLQLNRSLIDQVAKKTDGLSFIASLPSSIQENVAFQLKTIDAIDELPTALNFNKTRPSLDIGHLILFFDSLDTPRIPVNFFKAVCNICVHGSPGPVYRNLLRATGKFILIIAFLFFLMIVVMAFGNAYELSGTHQFLATLAGGFLPMLIELLPATKPPPIDLETLSFEGQVDEVIADYRQNWPILDLIVKEETNSFDEENDIGASCNKEKAGTIDARSENVESKEISQALPSSKESDKNCTNSKVDVSNGTRNSNGTMVENMASNVENSADDFVDLYINMSVNEMAMQDKLDCKQAVEDGEEATAMMELV